MSRIPNRDTPVLNETGAFETLWFRFLEALSRKEAAGVSNTASISHEINARTGRFRVPAASTFALVVNNQVTANSVVLAQFAFNDATGRVTSVSVANGSFTVNFTATTSESDVFFSVQ